MKTVPYKETYLWSEMRPRDHRYIELLCARLQRDNQWHFGAMSDECSFRTLNKFNELDYYVSQGIPLEWRYATQEERERFGWKH